MPMINMIAARRAEKKRLERAARALSYAIVFVMLVAASLYAFLGIRVIIMNGDLATVEASLSTLQPTVNQIHELEAATARLQPKVTLLTKAQQSTTKWRDLMVDLSASLPDKTWLTGMNVAKDDKGGTTTIAFTGMSAKQASVGETMLRVGEKRGLEGVNLKYTNLGKLGEKPVVNFELAADFAALERKSK